MKIQIGQHVIGGGRTYIISEIGNNHNGSIDTAIEMIRIAHNIGADCVKFQMRNIGGVY